MCDDEKRRSIRIRKPLAVQFSVESPDGLHWDESLIRDISENGMCLNTGTCMKAGEICVLRIRMPLLPQSFLELRGRVIDSVASRAIFLTRLEFIDPNEEQKQFLREYIAWALVNERGRK